MKHLMARFITVMAILALAAGGGVIFSVNGVTPARADDAHHAGTQTAEASRNTGATPRLMEQETAGTPMPGMDMPQEFDLMFIDMMIPHHEGAIAMAEIALTEGEHQEILDLAEAIIESQQAEIDQMKAWRDAWYPNAQPMPMDEMSQTMGEMMMQMPSMMATPSMEMMGMTTMMEHMTDPAAGAEALQTATDPFDQAFIELMIPHHQSAVAMAQVALQQAQHPEIKALAEAIIEAQEREIAQMQSWHEQWYGGTPEAGTPSAQQVDVTLREFAIESSLTAFEVDTTYRFTVTNRGVVPHEFMIMPRLDDMGQMDMATLDDMALVMIPIEDLPPGGSQTIDVTLSQVPTDGELAFVCAAPAHYDAGMRLAVSVSG